MTKPLRIVIKRYQNRKLYDMEHSCYVTLEEISDMIKEGHDIQIIDNKSQDDITSITLAQIIFEEQKKKTNELPLDAFRHIIQGGSAALKNLVEIGAKEINHVKHFVDGTVKPAVSGLQELPQLRHEIDILKDKIEALETIIAASFRSKK